MCLISVCPKGTEKDSKEVLDFIRSGAACNRQGSGFMYKRNGENTITVSKGYFNIEELIEKYLSLKLTKDDESVFHHRIGTSGGVTDKNTHPFVVSTEDEEVWKTNITTDKPCLVHNGIFGSIDIYEMLNVDMSDTFAFTRHIMSNENVMKIFLENKDLFKILFNSIIGTDKLCFLFPDRDLQTYGSFITHNSYMHSNSGYCRQVNNVGGQEWPYEDDDVWSYYSRGDRHSNRRGRNSTFLSQDNRFDPVVANSIKLLSAAKEDTALTKLILLDDKYVVLDGENFKQFRYIRKGDWDLLADDKKADAELFDLLDFDPSVQLLTTESALGTRGKRLATIPMLALINNCYYIPKGAYWHDIYSDYKLITDSKVVPSKSGIKTLKGAISANYKKTAQDKIYYKKLGEKFCKKALEMHCKDLEIEFSTGTKGPFRSILNVMSFSD